MAKSLKHFLVSSLGQAGQRLPAMAVLTKEETHHLKDVLRMKEGSLCILLDGNGCAYMSRLDQFLGNGNAQVELLETVSNDSTDSILLTVAQALPQDRKMDEIVQKAAELGLAGLIPLVTERTVVRVSDERFLKVKARWIRIMEQTMKQSKITTAPALHDLTQFSVLMKSLSAYDETYLCHTGLDSKPIREALLGTRRDSSKRILLLIGPEGGFSPKELEQAKACGVQFVGMGKSIMKTDTAFVAASSFVKLMCAES